MATNPATHPPTIIKDHIPFSRFPSDFSLPNVLTKKVSINHVRLNKIEGTKKIIKRYIYANRE